MVELSVIFAGLADAFTLTNIFFVVFGVAVGQFVGAVPGIGPIMTMAIAIPFTFSMTPLAGIGFLVGVSKGGLVGGAIPAVLINTPGTPDAASTALDGYPLAKQGKPLKATKMALFSSVTGDTFSDIVLITVSAPLAILALTMGPIEVFALMILTFSILAALIGDSVSKGVIAASLGLFCSTVGADPEHFSPRMIFGMFELYDGLPIVAVAVGALAIAELVRRLSSAGGEMRPTVVLQETGEPNDQRVTWKEYWGCRFTLARGALIGTFLGALPGIGSTAASFMSYASAKTTSKDPESFGKGNIHGIAASESANSAVAGANLIPLLTLGIPGSIDASLIITAFMIHGIQPGPLLFQNQGQLIYGLFGAMLIANFSNLCLGQIGMRFWTKVISAPESVIFSTAILLCFVGVSMSTSGLYGVGVMLFFAVVGYLLASFGYSIVIFLIALFLGDRFESSLGQALSLTGGDLLQIYRFPIALALILLAMFFLVWFFFLGTKRKKEGKKAASS